MLRGSFRLRSEVPGGCDSCQKQASQMGRDACKAHTIKDKC